MMHCTMDDLVALRAGEASVWARRHLDACPACRGELEALYQRVARLKALPALQPPRDRWGAVLEVARAAQNRRRRLWGAAGLATAAALAGVVVLRPFAGEPLYADELARVKQESATLESRLREYAPEDRVTSGRAAALAAGLEDRIAAIDGALGRAGALAAPMPEAELVRLWQERVDLMRQLVSVRVTRAAYVGL